MGRGDGKLLRILAGGTWWTAVVGVSAARGVSIARRCDRTASD